MASAAPSSTPLEPARIGQVVNPDLAGAWHLDPRESKCQAPIAQTRVLAK